jgi:hypothetical protein
VKARELQPDGSYRPVQVADGEKPFASQTFFIHHEAPPSTDVTALKSGETA